MNAKLISRNVRNRRSTWAGRYSLGRYVETRDDALCGNTIIGNNPFGRHGYINHGE